MLDISWGEIFVVGAVGIMVTGRKDLPAACRMAGSQVGRIVGLLQGARARADQFAAQNELRQLQNELRSGLRELDQVKMELAVAASSKGMVGRNLGATTASANRQTIPVPPGGKPARESATSSISARLLTDSSTTTSPSHMPSFEQSSSRNASMPASLPLHKLPPAIQSERAVMEDEWDKQGIGFRSRAEQTYYPPGAPPTGSQVLANLIKESLIFDQYDRVVGTQEAGLQERVGRIKTQGQLREDDFVTGSDTDKKKKS